MSLQTMNILYEKMGNERYLLSETRTFNAVCYEDNYFPKGKFKLCNSLFHSAYLVFVNSFVFYCQYVCRALSVEKLIKQLTLNQSGQT